MGVAPHHAGNASKHVAMSFEMVILLDWNGDVEFHFPSIISMIRIADGASIVASFDPSALMRTAQALRIGAMANKAARWIRRGSFMVFVIR
jgi:hypothetical protein